MLLDLKLGSVQQGDLDLEPEIDKDMESGKGRLMGALDLLNRRYGRGMNRPEAVHYT